MTGIENALFQEDVWSPSLSEPQGNFQVSTTLNQCRSEARFPGFEMVVMDKILPNHAEGESFETAPRQCRIQPRVGGHGLSSDAVHKIRGRIPCQSF
jgi:hypothetical protein